MVRAKRSGASALTIALIASAVIASSAHAVTRSEYVAQVDPICKAAITAEEGAREITNRRVFRHVKKRRRNSDPTKILKIEGRGLLQATAIFGQSIDQVAAVTPPAEDAALITQWLESLRVDLTLRGSLGLAQAAGKRQLANHRFLAVADHALLTNNLVAGFGFTSCIVNLFP